MPIGPRYCPKCNSIILFVPHLRKRFKEIEDDIVNILNHETTHWWLCKNISEEASLGFDAINKESDDLEISHDIPFDFTPYYP
jgi:hypothetical protein